MFWLWWEGVCGVEGEGRKKYEHKNRKKFVRWTTGGGTLADLDKLGQPGRGGGRGEGVGGDLPKVLCPRTDFMNGS